MAEVNRLHALVTESLSDIAVALADLDKARAEFKRPAKDKRTHVAISNDVE